MRRTLTLIGALLLLFAPAASAGLYVGGSVGNASLELTEDDFSFDEDDTGWKVFLGYSFLKFFAVEGGYVDFGSPDATFGKTTVDTDASAIDVFAVGRIPLGIVQLYAKAGLVNWDADISASGGGVSELASEDGTDAAYGVGLTVNLKKIGIRLEAEQFDTGTVDGVDTEVFMVSAGLEYRF